MKILAFDLANKTGVAFGPASGKPVCSTEILGEPNVHHGLRFLQALRMTKRLIDKHKPDLVVIEEPIAAGVAGGSDRLKLAMGYRSSVFTACALHRIPFAEYNVGAIRKAFIGVSNLSREKAKQRVFQRCLQFGWKVADDNESDACAVWQFACLMRAGVDRPVQNGLFGNLPHHANHGSIST